MKQTHLMFDWLKINGARCVSMLERAKKLNITCHKDTASRPPPSRSHALGIYDQHICYMEGV